jgi:dipeptidyl aminopeptidase/acylaminoacyl peptidase
MFWTNTWITTFLIIFGSMIPSIQGQNKIKQNAGVIVFQTERHGPNEKIYIMNADGSVQIRLTFNNAREVCPSISPNGQYIAFASDRDGSYQLFTMNPDGSNQMKISTAMGDYWPSWGIDSTYTGFGKNVRDHDQIKLSQNVPNPFYRMTQIEFYLPECALTNLSVYDQRGVQQALLINEKLPEESI